MKYVKFGNTGMDVSKNMSWNAEFWQARQRKWRISLG